MKDQRLLWTSIILLSWGAMTLAFVPATAPLVKVKTQLELSTRRDVLGSLLIGASAVMIPAKEASAFSQQLDDYAFEPQQQATDGKFDLNAAFVVRFLFTRTIDCHKFVCVIVIQHNGFCIFVIVVDSLYFIIFSFHLLLG